ISTGFALIIAGGAYLMGGLSRVIFSTVGNGNLFSLVESGQMTKDLIIPTLITESTVVAIPDVIQGLFVVLLLSASISTLTALVLSSASVLSLDLIKPNMPKLKEKDHTVIMRVLCLVFVLLSLAIHFLMGNTPIVSLMSLSWGVIGGVFLAPFLYGLLWKKTTKIAVYFSAFTCLLIAVVPPILLNDFSLAPVFGAISMIWGLIAVPLVTLFTYTNHSLPEKIILNAFGGIIAKKD
ncbi:MAG: sodium:solute symporter, partial [Clostridiales bacterium]|nr:sodium:solute symporter [Clostridiales bacterium]